MRPYLDASNARSTRRSTGADQIRPRSEPRVAAGGRERRAAPSSTRLTLATDAGRPDVARAPAQRRPERHGVDEAVSSRFGSRPDDDGRARISSPTSSATPVAAPSAVGRDDLGAGADLGAGRRAAAASARPARPGRPARRPSRPAAPPSLPAESASRTWRRAGGPRPQRGVADAAPGDGRPERLRSRTTRRRSPRRPSAGRAGASARRACRGRGTRGRAGARERVAEPGADVGRRLVAEVGEEARRATGPGGRTRRTRRVVGRPGAQPVDGPRRGRPTASRPGRPAAARRRGPRARRACRPCSRASRSRTTDGRSRPTVWASVGHADAGSELGGHVAPPTRSRAPRGRGRAARPRARYAAADEPVVAGADDDGVVRGSGSSPSSGRLPAAGPQDLERGEAAVGAHDPAARMRRRAASHRSRTGVRNRA